MSEEEANKLGTEIREYAKSIRAMIKEQNMNVNIAIAILSHLDEIENRSSQLIDELPF